MPYCKNGATWCKVCLVFRINFLPLCMSGQPRSAVKDHALQIFTADFASSMNRERLELRGKLGPGWQRFRAGTPRGRDTSHFPVTEIKSPVYVACAMYLCFISCRVSSYISRRFRMNHPPFCFFCLFFSSLNGWFFSPRLTARHWSSVTHECHYVLRTPAVVPRLRQPCFHQVLPRSRFSQLPDDAGREQQMGKS